MRKVLLYTEFEKQLHVSGLGKAIEHQKRALMENKIPYVLDPKYDYDVVHINFYGPKSYLMAKRAKKAGKKVVYHAHSTEEDFRNSFKFSNLISPLFKKWLIKCYQLGDCIITPTDYSKKILEGYGLKNIHAISNGIDLDFFKKNNKLGEKFRNKYRYTKDDKVIMGIGLYLERKGIIDFVELAKKMPNYKFIWFGNLDLKLVPKKIKQTVKTKLPNLIFAGHVTAEEIKGALSGSDLYIFPTYEETEGIPALEALACKTPTIVRDIPVFGYLKDKQDIYKAHNIEEFKDLAEKIISQKLPDLTANGYKKAEEKDIKKTGKELAKIYQTI